VLRVASTVGQLNYPAQPSSVATNAVAPVPLPVRSGIAGPSER
jgi:hypothetical protein